MTTTTVAVPSHAIAAGHLHARLRQLRARAHQRHPPALATLAKLRRAAGRSFGSVPEADAELLGLVPLASPTDGSLPDMSPALSRLLDDLLLVASLAALARLEIRRESPERRGSLGKDVRALRRSHPAAAEKAIVAALGAEREDLDTHLRRALMLLGSEGHPLDAGALAMDLGWWGSEGRRVQKRWAYDFWAGPDRDVQDDRQETT